MMPVTEQLARELLICAHSRLPLVVDRENPELLRVRHADYTYPYLGGLPIVLTDPGTNAERVADYARHGPPPAAAAGPALGRLLRGEGLRTRAARDAWIAVARGPGLRLAPGGIPAEAGGDLASDLVHVHYTFQPGTHVVGDPYALPYEPGAAEAVVLAGLLDHAERPAEILSEALRVLRWGGELLVVAAHLAPPRGERSRRRAFSPAGLEVLVREAGFEVLDGGPIAGPLAAASALVDTAARAAMPAGPIGRKLARYVGAIAAAPLLALRPLDGLLQRTPRMAAVGPGHWLRARRHAPALPAGPLRLHIGSGSVRLPGWLNVDLQPLPGVDVVADVTQGLLFRDAELIYAEHLLEHLRLDRAVSFLADCWSALGLGGVIRLSTPNLDWVLRTHTLPPSAPRADRLRAAVSINLGFHGWHHQFLWNRDTLEHVLEACGFVDLTFHEYGQSDRPLLRGVERHDVYEDEPGLPHVLIVEAVKGPAQPERLHELRLAVAGGFLLHMAQ